MWAFEKMFSSVFFSIMSKIYVHLHFNFVQYLYGIFLIYGLYYIVCIFRNWFYWRYHRVPFIPLKGLHLSSYTNDQNIAIQNANFYRQYHQNEYPLIGVYKWLKPMALIRDLNLIQDVLKKDFEYFKDRDMYHNDKDPLSTKLGTLNYDKWHPLKKQLSKAYSSLKLKNMFPKILQTGRGFIESLNLEIPPNSSIEIETRDVFERFMIDVIGVVGFNIKCNTLGNPNSELRMMMKNALQTNLEFPRNILAESHPNISRLFQFTKHRKDIGKYFVDYFENIIRNHTETDDYMGILNELEIVTLNEKVSLAYDFFSAGSTDASTALVYCIYELSLMENQNIQNRLRSEIDLIFEEFGDLNFEVLHSKMIYCDQVIKGLFIIHLPYNNTICDFR